LTFTFASNKPHRCRRRTLRNNANQATPYRHRREAAKHLSGSDKQPEETTTTRGEAEAPRPAEERSDEDGNTQQPQDADAH
jgi:hypothetical protein